MLEAIKRFVQEHLVAPARGHTDPNSAEHAVRLATAALLIEVMHVDSAVTPHERSRVIELIKTRFQLSAEETAELIDLSEAEAKGATDYFQFTSIINRSFTAEQKIDIIEHLWQVAYADSDLDKHEEHAIRKIAELLYVPHSAFIAAKLRVRDAQPPRVGPT